MIKVTVYKNRDNPISLGLLTDAQVTDITGTTRMIVQLIEAGPDGFVDSRASPSAFDWSTSGANGQLDLVLGLEKSIINADCGNYKTRLTIFDAAYANGLVWDHFWLEVLDG